MIPKQELENTAKDKINAYGKRRFTQDFMKGQPARKILNFETEISNLFAGRRKFSYERLLRITEFFSSES